MLLFFLWHCLLSDARPLVSQTYFQRYTRSPTRAEDMTRPRLMSPDRMIVQAIPPPLNLSVQQSSSSQNRVQAWNSEQQNYLNPAQHYRAWSCYLFLFCCKTAATLSQNFIFMSSRCGIWKTDMLVIYMVGSIQYSNVGCDLSGNINSLAKGVSTWGNWAQGCTWKVPGVC